MKRLETIDCGIADETTFYRTLLSLDKPVTESALVDEMARICKLQVNAPCRSNRWTLENDALLGTMSDAQLGKQISFSATNVRERRERLGIPPFGGMS